MDVLLLEVRKLEVPELQVGELVIQSVKPCHLNIICFIYSAEPMVIKKFHPQKRALRM